MKIVIQNLTKDPQGEFFHHIGNEHNFSIKLFDNDGKKIEYSSLRFTTFAIYPNLSISIKNCNHKSRITYMCMDIHGSVVRQDKAKTRSLIGSSYRFDIGNFKGIYINFKPGMRFEMDFVILRNYDLRK